jgi:hypothetical protein
MLAMSYTQGIKILAGHEPWLMPGPERQQSNEAGEGVE